MRIKLKYASELVRSFSSRLGYKFRKIELKLFDNTEKKINKLDNIVFFTEQHTHHYKSAIKIYKDNYFFGVGIKNFRHVCHKPKYKISEISCSTHPHNTYVQLLTELGIIGFLFISFFPYNDHQVHNPIFYHGVL